MSKIEFIGNVYPLSAIISFNNKYLVETIDEEIGFQKSKISISINNSKISVTVELNQFKQEYIVYLYKRVNDICTATLSFLSFSNGLGLAFELDAYIIDNSIRYPLIFKDDELKELAFSIGINDKENVIYRHLLKNFRINRALTDLTETIKVPHLSAINCGRVVEAICYEIGSSISSREERWTNMRNVLNLSKDYLKFITDISKEPRHGRANYISGNITKEIIKRSWIIMNRYFEYIKNGSIKLDMEIFKII